MRAYYAMFYVAEALLIGKKLAFSKHRPFMLLSANTFAKPVLWTRSFSGIWKKAWRFAMRETTARANR